MKLHNTLSRKIEKFQPLHKDTVRLYSCGPTVYDHAHIGNLSSYVFADTLRRVLQTAGYEVQHVMNFTDVDDKTIRRSKELYPDLSREEALKKLTDDYKQIFLDDMVALGNDTVAMKFISATESIEGMRALITDLYKDGFAYIADDGVYFSIEKYKSSGKKYGQLSKLDAKNTSAARINNDEYDKENIHDFALWKTRKDDEPAWEFELDGHDLLGRPGWHVECSVMSVNNLGQPFDIHTGGVDLVFPHHENEIAQSTAGKGDVYAKYFVHNEHLLVDGKKMAKSLDNFYTLQDLRERGFEPLAFRLMVLQSHYRNQSNFTWENLEAAQNKLRNFRIFADLLWQVPDSRKPKGDILSNAKKGILEAFENDLDTPRALVYLNEVENQWLKVLSTVDKSELKQFLEFVDQVFGLDLSQTQDLTNDQYGTLDLFEERKRARDEKDFKKADELRDHLKEQGIGVRDTTHGQIWYRL